MFELVKLLFIVLLSFSRSLATKCVSWNNESCMIRPALNDLNPVDLKYYQVIISLDKCGGSYSSVDGLSTKICVLSKTKNVNVFDMLTNTNKRKTFLKYISCDFKWKFDSTTHNLNQKWNNEIYQCECKNYCLCKKDYSWTSRTCICENDKYLKSIADTLVILCDEIIWITYIMSTNGAHAISINMSTNSDDKKVRYKMNCYILHMIFLVLTLLVIIAITCYHCAKHWSELKTILPWWHYENGDKDETKIKTTIWCLTV